MPTLQTLQDPILLMPWVCFGPWLPKTGRGVGGGSPSLLGSAFGRRRQCSEIHGGRGDVHPQRDVLSHSHRPLRKPTHSAALKAKREVASRVTLAPPGFALDTHVCRRCLPWDLYALAAYSFHRSSAHTGKRLGRCECNSFRVELTSFPGAWGVIRRAVDGVAAVAARPPSRNAEFRGSFLLGGG